MKRSSKRVNLLIGGLTGFAIAILLWFIELQTSDFRLFFTSFILTGAASGFVVGEVNRQLIRTPLNLEERQLYNVIGQLEGKYSSNAHYSQEALIALGEIKFLLEDRKL